MTLPASDRTILDSYLGQGFALFPVWGLRPGEGNERICACPSGPKFTGADSKKHPAGKHPHKLAPNGFKNATRDKAVVQAWARTAGPCNWGLVTGEPLPGGGFLLVLDVDPRNGGTETLAEAIAVHGALPAGPIADTGGNGEHYFLRTERPLASFSIGPGLETKGQGGYVCVEPSAHSSGGSYAWRIGASLDDVRIPEAPTWLVEGASSEEARPLREGQSTARDTVLGEAFALSGRIGTQLPDGTIAVKCPWADEHSDGRGRGADSSTVILPPAGGSLLGGFSCKHSHCSNRKWNDVLSALPAVHTHAARARYPMRPVVVPSETPGEASRIVIKPVQIDPIGEERTLVLARCAYKQKQDGSSELSNDPVNLVILLKDHPDWKGVLSFDEFTQTLGFAKDPPWHEEDAPGVKTDVWGDEDPFRIVLWFKRRENLTVKTLAAREAAIQVAKTNAVNPLKDYLDALVWDRKPRLDTWLSEYLGCPDTPYTRTVGAKWTISAIARAYVAGCKADHVLILEGPQGRGKSTALAALAGVKWFSDTPLDIGNKDAYLSIRGTWIVELAELASLKKAEADKVKAFFTSPNDKYRPPYGQATQTVPRRCVFAGSVNPGQVGYLKDDTGNRRYWPVECGIIDVEGLKEDRDQLWAEARERFRAGEAWWPTNETERSSMAAEQEEREITDAFADPIDEWLKDSRAWELYVKEGFIKSYDIAERALCIRASDLSLNYQMSIGSAMKSLGWTKGRRRLGDSAARQYIYTHPLWDERVREMKR